MITKLKIENFKSIVNQEFIFKPLNILTGTNSSGKSSVIQSLLFYSSCANPNLHLDKYLKKLGELSKLSSFTSKNREIKITPSIDDKDEPTLSLNFENNQWEKLNNTQFPSFEKELFYLSANRIGQENIATKDKDLRSGANGEFLFGFYEENKNKALQNNKLLWDKNSSSLSTQVIFWLEKILELKLEPRTQAIDSNNVKVFYANKNLAGLEISPFNLGAGISYLTKILILGLSLKPNNVLIIENPEVHLHPKAISKLAEFLAFLTKAGIQVLIETHSEHILNKMRYLIFKEELPQESVQIYYKEHKDENFTSISINKRGKYTDEKGQVVKFPKGFFDSDLDELLEMM